MFEMFQRLSISIILNVYFKEMKDLLLRILYLRMQYI